MPDREKVVTDLEALNSAIKRRVDDADDTYGFVDINLKYWQTVKEAIALLKAQELRVVHVTADISYRKIGECPTCSKLINSKDYPNYCGRCGQAVKWE